MGLLILPNPTKYRLMVGHGGSTVDKIRKETGCRIMVPRTQSGRGGEAITLHGEKEGLERLLVRGRYERENGGGEDGDDSEVSTIYWFPVDLPTFTALFLVAGWLATFYTTTART